MENFTVELTPAMMALIPAVAAILQILKRVEAVQKIKNWLPLMSVGVALGLGYLTNLPNVVPSSLVIGLVASGSYDLFKGTEKD